jgi:DNA-binding response OmpR family regulator/signal transduction histidine kinase
MLGKGCFRMDCAAAGKNNGGWGDDGDTEASGQIPLQAAEIVPASFTREYHLLAEVAANMSSGFILLNRRERIAYVNPSALRLLRIGKHDLLTPHDFDVRQHLLSLVADPTLACAELDRVWSSPEQDSSADIALADAAVRWLRVRSFPIRNDGGDVLGRGVLLDDISLEHSALEARSETLALAAHELKTPLAIIKGCATTLLGSSARWDPAMQREMLQMIDMQSDHLYDILNTLLDVWRLDAGTQSLRLTQVYLPELLYQLVARWRKQAPGYHFTLHIPPDVPALVCDVVRLEQVLNHLLKNAVTYSPPGKTVSIQAETNDIELRIRVTDEGIGIAPEHLDRIFDRFYRVHQDPEQPGGSGLGLAATRATIEAHGGRIWADSLGPGHGSTFYFTLPFSPRSSSVAQASVVPAVQHTTPAPQGVTTRPLSFKQDRRIRVLLAEGDARLTRYLRANLEEQQYRVQTVSHGVQFLRQLDLEEPDIILLATRLADMSGIELLQRLREFSFTPVIMLCDDCDEDERVQLFDLGSDDLVMKPFGMKELLARVRALLRRQSPPSEHTANQAIFTTGDLVIDHAQHLVMVRGQPVQLSRTEYKLLSTLAQNVGMVVTHELLLEKVWGPEYNRDIDFIWVYISRLRRKIEADSRHPRYILTVPDVGYKLAKL